MHACIFTYVLHTPVTLFGWSQMRALGRAAAGGCKLYKCMYGSERVAAERERERESRMRPILLRLMHAN
jgi:hypothetical protein